MRFFASGGRGAALIVMVACSGFRFDFVPLCVLIDVFVFVSPISKHVMSNRRVLDLVNIYRVHSTSETSRIILFFTTTTSSSLFWEVWMDFGCWMIKSQIARGCIHELGGENKMRSSANCVLFFCNRSTRVKA